MAKVKLRGKLPDDNIRRGFDSHNHRIVGYVFLVLLAYAYFFSNLSSAIGLPQPQDIAESLGWKLENLIDREDGNLESKILLPYSTDFAQDQNRLILFLLIFATFSAAYYLDIKFKRYAIVTGFLLGMMIIYRFQHTAIFTACHLLVFICLHYESKLRSYAAALFGFLSCYGILLTGQFNPGISLLYSLISAALFYQFYNHIFIRILQHKKLGFAIRLVLIHVWIPIVIITCVYKAFSGLTVHLTAGAMLFLFQWARLMVYHRDYEDKAAKPDLPLIEYLCIFMTPAALFNYSWAPYVGQAYSYLNQRYYCEDKNNIVREGLKLWLIALMYFLIAADLTIFTADFLSQLSGVKVYRYTGPLVRAYLRGEEVSTFSVLSTTMLDQARIFLVYGALTHFRVGTWRVFGYYMDPQYNKPWLATNLVNLWGRFAFHFREFLVRTFYYPVFFRYFKKHKKIRIFAATMVATAAGNHIWGHVPVQMIENLQWPALTKILSVWPYFLLLGAGISLTQVYLLTKKRARRPWTRDKWFSMDILCCFLTLQYFALIHVFIRPEPDLWTKCDIENHQNSNKLYSDSNWKKVQLKNETEEFKVFAAPETKPLKKINSVEVQLEHGGTVNGVDIDIFIDGIKGVRNLVNGNPKDLNYVFAGISEKSFKEGSLELTVICKSSKPDLWQIKDLKVYFNISGGLSDYCKIFMLGLGFDLR